MDVRFARITHYTGNAKKIEQKLDALSKKDGTIAAAIVGNTAILLDNRRPSKDFDRFLKEEYNLKIPKALKKVLFLEEMAEIAKTDPVKYGPISQKMEEIVSDNAFNQKVFNYFNRAKAEGRKIVEKQLW